MPARFRRRRFLVGLAVAGLVFGVGVGIVYGTPAFGVTKVDVRGVTFTETGDVREAAAIVDGASLAAVDSDDVAERVAKVPSVESVEVDRQWPHTVIIGITERSPRLAVSDGGKFVLVDESGVAYRTVSQAPSGTVLAAIDSPGAGDAATAAVLTVAASLTPQLDNELVKIKAKSATRISLELKDSRSVFWGDASDSDRKAEVATVLLTHSGQHFDVSAPDVPTVS
ncbi:MAG: cell division protein FtsQ/DivIB [Stackebrandtia sp.]